jgi:hypothetical protein
VSRGRIIETRAPVVADRLGPCGTATLLGLQATVGNRAVASLVAAGGLQQSGGAGAVQRATAAGAAQPANAASAVQRTGDGERLRSDAHATPGATDVGGWGGADTSGPGWNASGHQVGGMRRIPVDGIPGGLTQKVLGGASGKLTDEAADHRAIAVLPSKLSPGAAVDVIVHLHGYAEDAGTRPYAGWRQHGGGSVRDVDLDRVEQQMDSASRPQLMGVLPQGGEKSQFQGKDPYGLDFGPYLTDVLHRLAELKAFGAADRPPSVGRVIVSAHSGGGHTTARLLGRGGAIAQAGHPEQGRLGEVALFEAINNPDELKTTWGWVEGELARLRRTITSGAPDQKKDEAVASAPRLRAYSRKTGGYGGRHKTLESRIADWHAKNGSSLGAWRERVADLHRVVWTGVEHEHQVRERLDDAIAALDDPAADRPAAPTAAPGSKAAASTEGGPSASLAATVKAAGSDVAVRLAVDMVAATGLTDEIELTDQAFALVHPELGGRRIPDDRRDLMQVWRDLRREVVRPALLVAAKPDAEGGGSGSAHQAAVSSTAAPGLTGPREAKPHDLGQGAKGKPAADDQAAAHPAEAAEWTQLSKKVQDQFKGGFVKYLAVRSLYAKRLKGESPVAWLKQLDFSFAFCGDKLAGLDPRLTTRLTGIEDKAKTLVDHVRADKVPVQFAGAFQPRATTDKPDSLSDHALGLALHLNYANNPYIGRQGATSSKAASIIEKIAAGAGHEDFWKEVGPQKKQSAHDRIVTNYHAYANVSDAVKAYFTEMDSLEGAEKAARQKEYIVVKAANAGRDPKEGFYAHTANQDGDPMLQLVLLLAEGAGLQWGGTYASRPKDLHHFALKL